MHPRRRRRPALPGQRAGVPGAVNRRRRVLGIDPRQLHIGGRRCPPDPLEQQQVAGQRRFHCPELGAGRSNRPDRAPPVTSPGTVVPPRESWHLGGGFAGIRCPGRRPVVTSRVNDLYDTQRAHHGDHRTVTFRRMLQQILDRTQLPPSTGPGSSARLATMSGRAPPTDGRQPAAVIP